MNESLLFSSTERRCCDVLLLMAHPDDEAMFFVPSIRTLTARGHRLWLLCLSPGDFLPHQAAVRPQELLASCAVLGLPASRVAVHAFPDGPSRVWAPQRVAEAISSFLRANRFGVPGGPLLAAIVTFDRHGVSGHPNHSALRVGLERWRGGDDGLERGRNQRKDDTLAVEGWELLSTPWWRKYLGLLDGLFSWLWDAQVALFIFDPLACILVWMAMRAHRSQLVWFRYLFILFSRYSYMNTLNRIF